MKQERGERSEEREKSALPMLSLTSHSSALTSGFKA